MFKKRLAEIPTYGDSAVSAALAEFSAGDVCFMNCEMPLTRRGTPAEKTVNIRADPGSAEDFKTLGVDVVTLANNHMLDYGHEGLFDTLQAFDEAGTARTGAGATIDEALRPATLDITGTRVAFLGIATTLPPGSAAGIDRPGIAPVRVGFSFEVDANLMSEIPGIAPVVRSWVIPADLERVADIVERTKREADHVVIGLHWGVPTQRLTPQQGLICEYQQPLARALIDRGADAVIGNGSHNLHGVEIYRGRPILYSLGDLIFHRHALHGDDELETAIVRIDLNRDSVGVSFVPMILNDEGLPEAVSRADRDRIADILITRSKPFGTQFRLDEDALYIHQ